MKHYTYSKSIMPIKRNDKVIVGVLGSTEDAFYTIEGVAGEVWDLIGHEKSVDEIIDLLEKDYDIDREQLMKDVLALITDLLKLGLIVEKT